jgi:hypothetical protein
VWFGGKCKKREEKNGKEKGRIRYEKWKMERKDVKYMLKEGEKDEQVHKE